MELAQPELPSCHGIVSDVAQLPSLATAEDGLRLAWEQRAFGELRRGRVPALPGPLGLGHLLVVLLERALGHQLLHGRVLLLAVPVVLCLGRLMHLAIGGAIGRAINGWLGRRDLGAGGLWDLRAPGVSVTLLAVSNQATFWAITLLAVSNSVTFLAVCNSVSFLAVCNSVTLCTVSLLGQTDLRHHGRRQLVGVETSRQRVGRGIIVLLLFPLTLLLIFLDLLLRAYLPVGGGGGLLLLDHGGEPVDLGLVAQRHVAQDLRLDVPRHVVRPHRQLYLVRRPRTAFFI